MESSLVLGTQYYTHCPGCQLLGKHPPQAPGMVQINLVDILLTPPVQQSPLLPEGLASKHGTKLDQR